jgi:hypothetical protein
LRTQYRGEYMYRMKSQDDGENYIINNFIICTIHQILLEW